MKTTAKQIVEAEIETLRGMAHGDLFKFARAQGIDNAAAFSSFKRALLTHGIDYSALRGADRFQRRAILQREARNAALNEIAAGAELIFYTDAKARTERFAVCDKNGDPIWYGRFFPNDTDFNGEQSSGEMAAAKKAVWLAGKVREALGLGAIHLTLRVDAEWLCWANSVATDDNSKIGGKARVLGEFAQRMGIILKVEHIPGASNPADQYTVCSGFKNWRDNDLRSLAAMPA